MNLKQANYNLKHANEKALEHFINQLKSEPKESPIIEANKHLLEGANSTWAGAGLLELAGALKWVVSCDLALTDLSTGVKAIELYASGFGFMAGAVESEVIGAFVVNPSTIPSGDCQFSITTEAVGAGLVSLFLTSKSGTLYGNFTGPAEGISLGSMSGTGELTIIG